jgi:hypothetical protein
VFPSRPYDDKKDAKVYGDRAKYAITKLPNPLEFFGYIYCFTCILGEDPYKYDDDCDDDVSDNDSDYI